MHNDDYRNTAEKKGKFKTLCLGKGPKVNFYICEYVTGRKTRDKTEYFFDIGYVQKKLFGHFSHSHTHTRARAHTHTHTHTHSHTML